MTIESLIGKTIIDIDAIFGDAYAPDRFQFALAEGPVVTLHSPNDYADVVLVDGSLEDLIESPVITATVSRSSFFGTAKFTIATELGSVEITWDDADLGEVELY